MRHCVSRIRGLELALRGEGLENLRVLKRKATGVALATLGVIS